MKPGSLFIGILLVAAGLCGLLDATGVADTSQTIGQWWPLAIVAWALVDMGAVRRVTSGGIVVVAFGITLVADVQQLAASAVVWSGVAVVVGAAVLVAAVRRQGNAENGDTQVRDAAAAGGAS